MHKLIEEEIEKRVKSELKERENNIIIKEIQLNRKEIAIENKKQKFLSLVKEKKQELSKLQAKIDTKLKSHSLRHRGIDLKLSKVVKERIDIEKKINILKKRPAEFFF